MEHSPSKDLAEGLQSFHISSPLPQRNSDAGNNHLKQYLVNNEFPDSKFLSYLGDSESKSYIKRLGDWSMNYGTVQQRSKSPVKGDTNGATGSIASKENLEPPQFKQYLQNNQAADNSKQESYRDPESELILTASLNDISGIPTNTFKRHDHHERIRLLKNNDTHSVLASDKSLDQEEEDVDPALEARGVFDNILKVQKSNYDFHQDKPKDEPTARDSDGTSSYFGETPSSLSPNFGVYPEKPAIDGIKLITPEEMGLVFDNVNGVWYKPPTKNQDISSSRTIDNGDSTISEEQQRSENGRFIATSATTRVARNQPPLPIDEEFSEERDEVEDDTPLDAPQINPQFLLRGNTMRKSMKSVGNTTQNMIGNITTASQVETSFQQNKRELIAVLTDVLAPRKVDWKQLSRINLQGANLNQVMGLSEILPRVIDCNLNDNNLRGLQGVPPGTIQLQCRNNQLSTSYFNLDGLPHLETVDLSYNSIGHNLGLLANCSHLREVDLSHNKLKSLGGNLGRSRILKLDLSHNNIGGMIDFAQLIKYSQESEAGWATIEELNLSSNKITSVKNVRCLPNLRVLKLDENPIAVLIEPNEITSHNLKTLTITNTQGALTRIGQNQLPYRRLRILRTDCFPQLAQWRSMPRSLEELALTNGTTETLLPWQILPNALRRLAITKIQGLKELPSDLTILIPCLQELDISNNQVESCYKLIEALPTLCLVRLNLKNNPISSTKRGSKQQQQLIEVSRMACPRLKELLI